MPTLRADRLELPAETMEAVLFALKLEAGALQLPADSVVLGLGVPELRPSVWMAAWAFWS
jgi:hypothetical protein